LDKIENVALKRVNEFDLMNTPINHFSVVSYSFLTQKNWEMIP